MEEITIRMARPGDAGAIARLDVETWRTTYAGVLPAKYLVGLSPPRREFGWRMAILREPRDLRVAVDAAGQFEVSAVAGRAAAKGGSRARCSRSMLGPIGRIGGSAGVC